MSSKNFQTLLEETGKREKLFQQVDEVTSEFFTIVSSFNEKEINTIPFEGSWTAAQVAEHVRKSNNGIAQALQMQGKKDERDPGERIHELKNIFLDFEKKFKSPEFIIPAQTNYDKKDLVERLSRSIDRIKKERESTDLSEVIQLSVLGTISKMELLHFVTYHTQRHIHQLKNISKTIKTKTMSTINPYLNFPGTTEQAFNFYRSVFGGEFSALQRFGEGQQIPPSVKDKIMHVSLPVGNGYVLMGTDACEEMGFKLTQGNNVFICIAPDTKEEATRLFNSLSADGKVNMQLQDTFWGAYYGDCTDKFGIHWMINYTYPPKN